MSLILALLLLHFNFVGILPHHAQGTQGPVTLGPPGWKLSARVLWCQGQPGPYEAFLEVFSATSPNSIIKPRLAICPLTPERSLQPLLSSNKWHDDFMRSSLCLHFTAEKITKVKPRSRELSVNSRMRALPCEHSKWKLVAQSGAERRQIR